MRSAAISLFRPRNGANEFWNGSTWIASPVNIPLTLSTPGATSTGWTWTQQAPSASDLDSGPYGLFVFSTDKDNANSAKLRRDFTLTAPANNAAPVVTMTAPDNGQSVVRTNFLTILGGSASDDYGVKSASIALFRKRNGANEFWNGNSWSATQTFVPLQLSSAGSTSTNWSWTQQTPAQADLDNGAYGLYVYATDRDNVASIRLRRDFNLTAPANGAAPAPKGSGGKS